MDIPSILDTAKFRHRVLDGVSNIANSIQGFQIPEFDELILGYYGTTNNVSSVIYKKAGDTVATLNLEYDIQPPVANDARIVKVSIIS